MATGFLENEASYPKRVSESLEMIGQSSKEDLDDTLVAEGPDLPPSQPNPKNLLASAPTPSSMDLQGDMKTPSKPAKPTPKPSQRSPRSQNPRQLFKTPRHLVCTPTPKTVPKPDGCWK